MKLTAIILTLNEAQHISDCIDSLHWCDEIVVFDSHSQDETVQLALGAGARVGFAKFENYAQQRNAALDFVESDWVFFVDADERGSAELGAEIRQRMQGVEAGWHVPRHNYIFGKLTLGAGWWPDYQLRLFQHGKVRYERPVHEVAVVDGLIGHLKNPLIHYNYENRAQFHATQRKYTAYEATILKRDGVIPKFHTPYTMPLRHFYWRFVTLRGYRDGLHGLYLCLMMGYYEHQKYRMVVES
jgi:glycosyltransferase involved in cell wall biosynthesis